MNLANNKILITGGASGIGLGLTERFIKENNTVIICGRRQDVLNEEVIEVLPPKLNTDLGGKGLHDDAPPVADFIVSVFEQLKEGKNDIGFGFSANLLDLNNNAIAAPFNMLNPSQQ